MTFISICIPLLSFANTPSTTEKWVSNEINPPVTISIHDKKVWIKTWDNITEQEIRAVNQNLLDQHKKKYVLIKDFNKDGIKDVGLLDGAGYGGNNKCYSVYEYDSVIQVYKKKASFTACP